MKTESVHTLIIGAGPSGLGAGYVLAKGGINSVVLEKDNVSGGLMRSMRHGDFILDVGRKELYNRLAKVDEFWSEILGDDYRSYDHRTGILYNGHILDMSPAYRGVLRGMPLGMFTGCCWDFFWARARLGAPKPRNLQEYWFRQRGRRLTQIANQGFQEKLLGRKWVDVPMPENYTDSESTSFWFTMKQGLVRAFTKTETDTYKGIWRHPAKGTGQICESLQRGILDAGGRIHFGTRILEMNTSEGAVTSVLAEVDSETILFKAQNVISSAPMELLEQLLFRQGPQENGNRPKPQVGRRRVVVLVYLFLNEEPRFPHFWLQVTCPRTRIGRISNYAALNTDMVPKGKTCLCCEIFCYGEDPVLAMDTGEVAELVLNDCARFGVVDPKKCFDKLVVKFPGADASQNRQNWLNQGRQKLFAKLRPFENLYPVNRTDLDIATLAGIEAGQAILAGNRSQFDLHVDPRELGIRSATKAFEFRNPIGIEM